MSVGGVRGLPGGVSGLPAPPSVSPAARGGEEAQQGHNILYHPLSSINTTSLIYPASISSETGEGS